MILTEILPSRGNPDSLQALSQRFNLESVLFTIKNGLDSGLGALRKGETIELQAMMIESVESNMVLITAEWIGFGRNRKLTFVLPKDHGENGEYSLSVCAFGYLNDWIEAEHNGRSQQVWNSLDSEVSKVSSWLQNYLGPGTHQVFIHCQLVTDVWTESKLVWVSMDRIGFPENSQWLVPLEEFLSSGPEALEMKINIIKLYQTIVQEARSRYDQWHQSSST